MKFGQLQLENFSSIQFATIDLGSRGLVNVEGVNRDDTSAVSNGAGKSSVFDGLSWCLFDETARGESGDGVVNRVAGKGCRVSVELIEGADRWSVTRHRKHKTGKNRLFLQHLAADGTMTDLTKGTDALTQAKLVEILGCSHEVFVGAVYAGQERMPDLPGMTDKNLKVLVEEASGTTLLDKGYRLALDGVTLAKGELATQTAALERAHENLAHAHRAARDTSERLEAWDASRGDRVRSMIEEAKAAAKNATDHRDQITAKGLDRVSLNSEIATHDAAIKAVAGEKIELARLELERERANNRWTGINHGLTFADRRIATQRKKVEEVAHQIGCPCETCDRPYAAEDIAPAKAIAEADLENTIAAFAEEKAEAEVAQKTLTAATKARDAFAATMTDVTATIAARDAASARLGVLEGHTNLQAAWTKIAKDKMTAIAAAKVEENPFTAQLAMHKATAAEKATALEVTEAALVKRETAFQVAQDIASVFAPSGVRAHILDTVTPFLNDRTARYLGTLSDGNIQATWTTLVKNAKGELKEKFAIEVDNDKGGSTFRSVSGGEKRKVRVACALALQDLVASRATKAIELFIGDEVDDALDRAGLERLMTILEEKARERGSVFVISHGDLKDWIRTTLTVTKENKISTLAEAA